MNTKQRKKYLLEHKSYLCEICSNDGNWNNKQLSLQIDHIDGNSSNDNICNLRFLCPNCHSQTSTFTGRNTKTKTFVKPSKEEFVELYKIYTIKEISIIKAVSLRVVYQWFKSYIKENKPSTVSRKLCCEDVITIRNSTLSTIQLSKIYELSDTTMYKIKKLKVYKDCN